MPKEDITGALEHDEVNSRGEIIQVVVKVIVQEGMYAQERDAEAHDIGKVFDQLGLYHFVFGVALLLFFSGGKKMMEGVVYAVGSLLSYPSQKEHERH